jgi:type II secretory pathway component PulK
VLAVLSNGLSSLGLSDAYYDLWEGLALIAVLVISVLLQRLVVGLEARRQVEHNRTAARDLALQAA